MIVKIICAGFDFFSKLYTKNDNEYIIAVDGGMISIVNCNIKCDLLIGDFDSCDLKKYDSYSKKVLQYSPIKDQSDLELAIDEAIKLKPTQILIYNATGLRQDHFYAALNLIKKYHFIDIRIIDDYNEIFVINCETYFDKDQYKYISFFSIDNNTVIDLKGFKYELDNYLLNIDDSLCLSNEIIKRGKVRTNKRLLVIKSK